MKLFLVTLLVGAVVSKTIHYHQYEKDGNLITTKLEANEPNLCDTVQQYSGYFTATENKNYFYWFFESRNAPSTDPLIMWLTGGPGCSSQLALLVENGPCHVNQEGTDTIPSTTSWNTNANIFWIDQPANTGFSYGGSDDTSETEIAEDMWAFLQNFIAAFPQYFNQFYVFGESYGGHYVPAVTNYIYTQNNKNVGFHIPLVAFAVGNGLTDPYIQFAYYATMAYNSTTAPSVIPLSTYNKMTADIPECQNDITQCNKDDAKNPCDDAYNYCMSTEVSPVTDTGINPYDLRKQCGDQPLCYNFDNVDKWLNNATVQKELGVDKTWKSCNNAVNFRLTQDWMVDYQEKIPPMLASGIRGLIYAGDQDFICNWLGNQAWALALDWDDQKQFENATVKPWHTYGNIRTYSNFTFLQVFQAGHMVPMDQPEAALTMVNEYLDGKWDI